MSTVFYNGVFLDNLVISSASSDDIMSEDGQEYLYTHYLFECDFLHYPNKPLGFFNSQSPPANLSGKNVIGNASLSYTQLENLLNVPRQNFAIYEGGVISIAKSPSLDAKYGPYPKATMITQIRGPSISYLMKFRLEAYTRNPNYKTQGVNWISHRYHETYTSLRTGQNVRTRSGTLSFTRSIIAADTTTIMSNPIVDPGPDVANKYRRVQSDWDVTSDGLTLRYIFRDEQVQNYVPAPAIDGSGYFEEVTSGARRIGRFNLSLTGTAKGSTPDLIRAAIIVLYQRVFLADAELAENGSYLFEYLSIQHSLYQNQISVSAQVKLKQIVNGVNQIPGKTIKDALNNKDKNNNLVNANFEAVVNTKLQSFGRPEFYSGATPPPFLISNVKFLAPNDPLVQAFGSTPPEPLPPNRMDVTPGPPVQPAGAFAPELLPPPNAYENEKLLDPTMLLPPTNPPPILPQPGQTNYQSVGAAPVYQTGVPGGIGNQTAENYVEDQTQANIVVLNMPVNSYTNDSDESSIKYTPNIQYDYFKVELTFRQDLNQVYLGSTSGSIGVVIPVSCPLQYLDVVYTAQRRGAVPEVPATLTTTIFSPIGINVDKPASLFYDQNGYVVYQISGSRSYAILNPAYYTPKAALDITMIEQLRALGVLPEGKPAPDYIQTGSVNAGGTITTTILSPLDPTLGSGGSPGA